MISVFIVCSKVSSMKQHPLLQTVDSSRFDNTVSILIINMSAYYMTDSFGKTLFFRWFGKGGRGWSSIGGRMYMRDTDFFDKT